MSAVRIYESTAPALRTIRGTSNRSRDPRRPSLVTYAYSNSACHPFSAYLARPVAVPCSHTSSITVSADSERVIISLQAKLYRGRRSDCLEGPHDSSLMQMHLIRHRDARREHASLLPAWSPNDIRSCCAESLRIFTPHPHVPVPSHWRFRRAQRGSGGYSLNDPTPSKLKGRRSHQRMDGLSGTTSRY